MYETGAPPAPPPLLADRSLAVADEHPPPPRVGPSYDSVTALLPGGPPPGTATYRLRGAETAQDG